ncbi:MAG: Fe-S cluster assembly protein SufD [Candidatus Binatota bacterium]|nr:Fe-S cluster assembly protein SufD [Candidatus Binatota bacterium]
MSAAPSVLDGPPEVVGGADHEPRWLADVRQRGRAAFRELGLPTTRHEDWKYTDVSPIAELPLAETAGADVARDRLRPFHLESALELVFVNGKWREDLSTLRPLPNGVHAKSLAVAVAEAPSALESELGSVAALEGHAFTALNTASFADGAVVVLDDGAVVPGAIHLLFVSVTGGGAPIASHPRVLILAGPESRAAIVETHLGFDGDTYFTNAVTEIRLEEGATVEHYRLQVETPEAFHVARVVARQGARSKLLSSSVSLGAKLARIDVETTLAAEDAECVLDGLYLAAGRQHVDHHTAIDHRQPRCRSRELYKGILDGRASGVFNGKVWIRLDAQQSDAHQVNRNLLLSDDAEVDTKPELEILADDVRCSHGATVGQLDEDAVYYLRSRGIGERSARDLLVYGFANEVVNRIRVEPLRVRLEEMLWNRFRDDADPEEAR